MDRIIEKKTLPEYFEKVLSGEKKFDLRLADFDIAEGDTLVFREWDPATKDYTGREVKKQVTMVLKTKDTSWHNHTPEEIEKYGWQVIGVEDL